MLTVFNEENILKPNRTTNPDTVSVGIFLCQYNK